MTFTIEDIKYLRDHTGMSFGECRGALKEAGGSRERALELLRQRGVRIAEKKAFRETREGRIESYAHATGKIAALVELQCETDFVARNEVFKSLAHEVAMQIAAMAPASIEELLGQDFIREPGKTVGGYLTETIARLGENIKVTRFERWEM